MTDDSDLLRSYAETGSEAAFAQFVERHLTLVYFAARRRAGGNDALAEDIAQHVFTTAAREAGRLARHTAIVGWLYTTTRFVAAKTMRAEQTRRRNEESAHALQLANAPEEPADWERLRPVIDAALDTLGSRDREAVLRRFFGGQAFAELGATLAVSEDAARMRVDRALEKLRQALVRRGVTSTSAALAAGLTAEGALAAPAGLGASITAHALAGAPLASGAVAVKFIGFMSTTKLAVGVAGLAVIAATAFTVQQRQATSALRAEMADLRQQTAAVPALRAENQRLQAAGSASADQLAAEHAEVLKLRGEVDAMKKGIAAARARMAAAAANGPAEKAAPATDNGMFSVDLMKNVGNSTPSAAAQSMVWAMQRADVKRVAALLRVESPEKERIEAIIATLPPSLQDEYGSPARLIAMMMCGTPHPLSAVQLVGEDEVNDQEVVHHVQIKLQGGEVRRDDVRFKRDADGWKQVVSSATVDRVIAFVQGKK